MNVQEFYDAIGGNYQEIYSRFPSDDKIIRFLKMFNSDSSYSELVEAIESKKYTDAFYASHSLKGISLNLSFAKLSQVATELTECLRNLQDESCVTLLFELVQKEYTTVDVLLKELLQEN